MKFEFFPKDSDNGHVTSKSTNTHRKTNEWREFLVFRYRTTSEMLRFMLRNMFWSIKRKYRPKFDQIISGTYMLTKDDVARKMLQVRFPSLGSPRLISSLWWNYCVQRAWSLGYNRLGTHRWPRDFRSFAVRSSRSDETTFNIVYSQDGLAKILLYWQNSWKWPYMTVLLHLVPKFLQIYFVVIYLLTNWKPNCSRNHLLGMEQNQFPVNLLVQFERTSGNVEQRTISAADVDV